MLLCLGEPPVRFLWCWLLFFISFLFFILLLFFIHFYSSFCCCSSFIAFQCHPSLVRCTFSPVHRRVICDNFIFNLSKIFFHSFTASAKVLNGHFLPTGVFYPTLLHRYFTCAYQGFPGSRQFFLEICRASYWSLKHRLGPSVCLIHSNPQSSYSEEFMFKFYHILSRITCAESLIFLLLIRFELLPLVQSHM